MVFSDLFQRAKALLFHSQAERELDEELRDHLARETAARARAGNSAPAREAAMALGGIERVKEEVRDARGIRPLEDFAADTRYALRALRRNLGFTLTVMSVLGLAIGATTVVFAVVNRVVRAGLPYPEPDRLVRIYQKNSPTNLWSLSIVDLQAIQQQQRSFDAFGAAQISSASVSGAGAPQRMAIGRVTDGFFSALRVEPAFGRLLQPGDDAPSVTPGVVVSHRFAEASLGGATHAVGKGILIDGVGHTIVGVLPPGRGELAGITAEIWPILQLSTPNRRGPFGYRGIARLKPGVTLEQATADLAGISERIFPLWAAGFQDRTARLTPVPLRDAVIGGADRQVKLFAGAVALTLLLAIANVATLMLVRTAGREHELTVRIALGAGRHRVIRLLATECLVLTLLAGVVGLGVAAIAIRSVGRIAPTLPRLAEVHLDLETILFALIISVGSGILVSLSPLSSSLVRGRLRGSSLAISPARTGPSRRASFVRGALVAAEFALALPLLMGSGLLLNSFLRLQQVSPGFDPTGVHSILISLPVSRYDSATGPQFWRLAESRVASIDGITGAGLASSIPPNNGGDVNNFDLLDRPVPSGTSQPVVPWSTVTPGYFSALQIPLLEGRLFTVADSGNSPPVVVASRAWAAKYYPGTSALGRQLYTGGCSTCPPATVVGVVGDVPYLGLAAAGEGMYAPLAQAGGRTLNLVVRSRLESGATFAKLRSVIATLDPDLAPAELVMTEHLDRALGDPRRWTAIVGGFAAAGVLLSALGVFGLMSFVVRQRRRELSVRLALGAPPHSLLGLVMRRGMGYAVAGTAVGLGLAAFESRWLGSLLYNVEASDPVTLAAAVVVILVVAALSCWLPGIEAMRIRPLEVASGE